MNQFLLFSTSEIYTHYLWWVPHIWGTKNCRAKYWKKKSVKLAWFFSHSIFYCWSLYSPLVVGVLGVSTGVSRVFNKKKQRKSFSNFFNQVWRGQNQYLVIICLGSWYSTIWHTFVQVFLTYPPVHWKTLDCNFAPTVC